MCMALSFIMGILLLLILLWCCLLLLRVIFIIPTKLEWECHCCDDDDASGKALRTDVLYVCWYSCSLVLCVESLSLLLVRDSLLPYQ